MLLKILQNNRRAAAFGLLMREVGRNPDTQTKEILKMKKMYVVEIKFCNDEQVNFFETLQQAQDFAKSEWDYYKHSKNNKITVASCSTCEKNEDGKWDFAEVNGFTACDYDKVFKIYENQ